MIPGREKQQMCTAGTAGRGGEGEGEGSGSDDQSPGIFLYISYSSALFSSCFSWANGSLSKAPIRAPSPVHTGNSDSFFRACLAITSQEGFLQSPHSHITALTTFCDSLIVASITVHVPTLVHILLDSIVLYSAVFSGIVSNIVTAT